MSRDSRGEIHFKDELSGLDAIVEFIKKRPTLAVSLAIYSDDVLFGVHLTDIEEDNIYSILGDEVFHGELDDFLVTFRGELYAFARKREIKEILQSMEGFGDQIIGLNLGPVNELLMARYKQEKEGEILQVGCFQFDLGLSPFTVEVRPPQDMTLDNRIIERVYVPAFCAALNALTGSVKLVGASEINSSIRDLPFKRFYLNARLPILITLLLLFLCNALFFVYLNDRNLEFRDHSAMIQGLAGKQGALQKYVDQNKELIEGRSELHVAALCDMIGSSVPRAIELDRIAIRPRQTKKKDPEQRMIEVVIEGQAGDPTDYARWVDNVRQMSWVSSVAYQQYNRSDEDMTKGNFRLILLRNVE
ncbi:MAG: hypothetical protein RIC30_13720 [Marinoscillum sp.]|uniref:hypothetical protein n=1 Tax=Marinoscillum sp. TaxID=2024838 RepID=UPI0032F32C87